ncbi:MAG TPA: DsbA family oxidoreductase [Rhizomicrobium sp.]|jgi:predicted DsbA family dithiol-disulfide isomerase|nr:DsbA family oxidoreductase [Rhizomicrobium sp.]
MEIDIVSDTVCPWCYIGERRIAKAMAMRPDIEFNVHWRPYRLDPNIPPEGVNRRAYMRAKFGDSPDTKARGQAIRDEGAGEGINFAFDAIEKSPNTLNSHRLIRWAANNGVQTDIVQRLFAAYFEEGRDIGDPSVLEVIASDAGMDSVLVAELLASDADVALIEREDQMAHEMGISGVPTFIFNNRFLISGAREAELLVRVIDKVLESEDPTMHAPAEEAEAEEEE